MSKSLYTEHRPQSFEDVIGQATTKKIIINSITGNKINHAYLLCGIRGTGKTTLARIFAKAINCTNISNGYEPCNECFSCKQTTSSSSLDVIEIDAASNNGVDEIRDLTEKANYSTTTSKYKVYIIDEVHMLSKAAFNALLKTLEEPPENTIFILATTEMNKLPDTILSRTLVLNLETLSDDDVVEGLSNILKKENIEFESGALEYIAKTSGGSLRDAISNLEVVILSSKNISKESVIKTLGLIDYDVIKDNLINNPNQLIQDIRTDNKDPKKVLNMIIEVITSSKDIKSNDLLSDLLEILTSIKDPSIIKIALITSLFKWSPTDVSRETSNQIKEETKEQTHIEDPEEADILNTEEITLLNTKTEEVKFADDLIVREQLKSEQPIENDSKISLPLKDIEEHSENPLDNETEILEEVAKDENTEEVEETVVKKSKITDFINAKHYITVLFNWNETIFSSIKNRWEYIDQYQNKTSWRKYVSLLNDTEPLASSEDALIIGFSSNDDYELFKECSLDADLLNFIHEITGKNLYVLPVLPDQWKKIVNSHKQLSDKGENLNEAISIPKIDDKPIKNKNGEIETLFGEDVEYR